MKLKSILAAVTAMSMVLAMGGVSTYALFEDDGASDSSTVMEELTTTGTVTRSTGKALLITPDDTSLGTSVAVTYSNSSNFNVGDKVKVSYNQAPTTTDGVTTINADKVELVSSGSSTPAPVEESKPAETTTKPAETTTTKPATSTTTTDKTPGTGNAGVGVFGAVSAVALAAIGVLNMKNSENK